MSNDKIVRCKNGHGFDTNGTEELVATWEGKVIAWLGWCDKCESRVIWRYPGKLSLTKKR